MATARSALDNPLGGQVCVPELGRQRGRGDG